MRNGFGLRLAVGGVVFAAVCAAAAAGARGAGAGAAPWYSVVPPLLAVTLALVTRRLLPSLIAAVVVGGLLSAVPGAPSSAVAWGRGLTSALGFAWSSITDPVNLQILAFVILVLTLISVILVAGGIHAVIAVLARYARGPRSTQFVTVLMGLAIFIDDYANTMLIGSAMRPLTDKHRVSREKLAFLVDATSAPVAGLAIVSTWIGYEVGLFGRTAETLKLGVDGYSMFFDAVPFRFYCMMAIAFVVINALTGRDFGPMARAERRARSGGLLAEPDANPLTSSFYAAAEPHPHARPRLRMAVVPVAILFAMLLGGLWRDGGGAERPALDLLRPTAWRDVIAAAENNILILAIAAAVALAAACALAVWAARTPPAAVGRTLVGGVRGSLLPIVILVLAWSLKAACDALGTGAFLAGVVSGVISPNLFPAVLFGVAGLTAFATGTSWGTMAILIPTATPVALALDGGSYGLVTMMSLGAVLDGAIFGDHASPISDTTLMSSISTSCDHLHHVRTQMPYALLIAACAVVAGYLPAAAGLPSVVGLLIGVAILVAVFFVFGRRADAAPAGGSAGGRPPLSP